MAALQDFACPTLAQADQALADGQPFTRRAYLGMSAIGGACERALWYQFRWVATVRFDAVTLKRFADGHASETVAVNRLKATPGLEVHDVDASGDQFGFRDFGGHFAGHMDGVCLGLVQAPKTWHVIEFKTHSAKSFAQLVAKGVVASKPQHAAQMQIYMHLMGLTRAFYLAVCKDNDALYAERVEADPAEADRLLAKAGRIIDAARPPSRISEDPAWFECRMCSHHALCHGGQNAAVNCRTCLHSTAVEGGWHCVRHDRMLGSTDQRLACSKHLFIPDLVAGDIVEAGDDFVTYRLKDGTCWVNNARDEDEVQSC